jgi:beta-glucosidase/6-phospho-beta-glucosidase/beta-galactosidase
MRPPDRPQDFPDFAWAVGEEGSDPTVQVDGRLHRHDQFAASGHYDHLEQDVEAVRGLGIRILRYGMPWRLCEVEPNVYDWGLWDRALGACEKAGVEPVVDLCHFGLPDHYPGFLDPRWVEGFVRYVEAFLARYPAPCWFTPVNEPGTTALGSGLLGGWNDRRKSQADWARILANVTLANLEACARVRSDRDGWWIGCEGFGIPVAVAEGVEAEVEKRRALGWLVWDLHLGVTPAPEAAGVLEAVDDGILARIEALATTRNVIAGHDVYPVSTAPVGGPPPAWSVRDRIELYEAEARRWHDRYRVPFWVGETSNLTLPVEDQIPWLRELCGALNRLREAGLPARGLCWYSRGDQYDWQTMLLNPRGAVTEVGLFDAQRRARPVAAELTRLAAAGAP